jgi:hypothetical protein
MKISLHTLNKPIFWKVITEEFAHNEISNVPIFNR